MGLNGLNSLTSKVQRMERDLDRKPKRTVSRHSARTVSTMKGNVVEQDAVASTGLFRGIHYRRVSPSRFIIESSAGYSGFVEFGTGPKHVENPYTDHYDKPEFSNQLVAALVKWASIKPSLPSIDPTEFGFKVAMSISGRADGSIGGTAPQPFFLPAWKAHKPLMIESVEEDVRDAVRR